RAVLLDESLQYRLSSPLPAGAECHLRGPIGPPYGDGRRQDPVAGLFQRGVPVFLVAFESRARRLQHDQALDTRLDVHAPARANHFGGLLLLAAARERVAVQADPLALADFDPHSRRPRIV